MTGHADTIRRKRAEDNAEWRRMYNELRAERDALLAERQQAQDKLWEQSEAAANLVKEVERLEAERQQLQEDLQKAEDYADSLFGELEAEKHAHRKDNEYLIGQRQAPTGVEPE